MDHLLSYIIFIPLLGAALITLTLALPVSKAQRDQLARFIALGASAIPLVFGLYLWSAFSNGAIAGTPQYVERITWIRSLGIEYFVGVDGISVSMVILSTLISFVATIASMPWWKRPDEHDDPAHPHFSQVKVPGYMAMLLILQTGMSGTFASLDMFLFFVFWEVMLLPMYFLIGIWGGPRKEYAAIKFFLYTLAGSVLLLLAIIALHFRSGDQALLARLPELDRAFFDQLVQAKILATNAAGEWGYLLGDGTWVSRTFDLTVLAKVGQLGLFDQVGSFFFGITFSKLIWVFMFIAFAVKVPMFPFHTWLPDAHVEAPTPVSVILAGVLLKMGIYGMLRFNWAILPEATRAFGTMVAVFGVINIVYAAFVCLAQKDLKKLIAYSSVSHMGFSLVGMVAMTEPAISGAVLNLFTHGLISPMLFLIVGVIYDRAHHREIEGFGGIAKVVPEYTALMGLAFFASLGLPGLAGFISEFLVLSGSFANLPWHTAIAALSLIITAAYYLWAIQRMFLGKLNEKYAHLPDLNWRERLTLYPLAALTLVFGFYPNVMLNLINTDLHALLKAITRGAA